MPRSRHARRPDERTAAAERVRALLGSAPGGWVPQPPADAAEGEPEGPAVGPDEVSDAEPEARSWDRPHEAALAPEVPGLLDRLRAGRLDPGRAAVVGLGLVVLLACLVAGLLVLRGRPREVAPPAVTAPGTVITGAVARTTSPAATRPTGAAAGTGTLATAEVVVAVAGEVRRPGVVQLPAGSRVDDAVRAAGGLLPGATPGLLNLARRLVDGEQVLVGVGPSPPAPGEAAGPPTGGAAAPGALDLNTATAAELDALPGIGPVLADRIVAYRTQNGAFRSVDQLREVSGIGEAKYASLKDAVRV